MDIGPFQVTPMPVKPFPCINFCGILKVWLTHQTTGTSHICHLHISLIEKVEKNLSCGEVLDFNTWQVKFLHMADLNKSENYTDFCWKNLFCGNLLFFSLSQNLICHSICLSVCLSRFCTLIVVDFIHCQGCNWQCAHSVVQAVLRPLPHFTFDNIFNNKKARLKSEWNLYIFCCGKYWGG